MNMNEKEIELTDSEASELRALRVRHSPPDSLKRNIVTQLLRHELLRPRWYQMRSVIIAAGAAAAILLVVFGAVIGVWLQPSRTVAGTAQPAFMLLLRSREGSLAGNENDRVREYGIWAGDLVKKGQYVDAGRLSDASKKLTKQGSDPIPANDTPVSGYFIIRAADLDQAVEIARNCPHITYGGELEVRPIDLRRN
jgi:hypothetical protein